MKCVSSSQALPLYHFSSISVEVAAATANLIDIAPAVLITTGVLVIKDLDSTHDASVGDSHGDDGN